MFSKRPQSVFVSIVYGFEAVDGFFVTYHIGGLTLPEVEGVALEFAMMQDAVVVTELSDLDVTIQYADRAQRDKLSLATCQALCFLGELSISKWMEDITC